MLRNLMIVGLMAGCGDAEEANTFCGDSTKRTDAVTVDTSGDDIVISITGKVGYMLVGDKAGEQNFWKLACPEVDGGGNQSLGAARETCLTGDLVWGENPEGVSDESTKATDLVSGTTYELYASEDVLDSAEGCYNTLETTVEFTAP